ncbi:MAG: flavin reductase family protein [Dehalococcoidia bacterium]|nr:flavin reductase family protein [Dehalococcoidia bacterium]
MILDSENLSLYDLYRLLSGTVLPRPIAFVSTVSPDGVFNLAPFSFYTILCSKPAMLGISIARRDGQKKDTVRNIELTGDFVVNVVTEELTERMNITAADYPLGIDEFQEAKLTPLESDMVKSPRLAESPVNMECRLDRVLEFGRVPTSSFVIGEVVRFHIKDEFYQNGRIDFKKMRPIGRLAGDSYCRISDLFDMKRPGE